MQGMMDGTMDGGMMWGMSLFWLLTKNAHPNTLTVRCAVRICGHPLSNQHDEIKLHCGYH